MHITKQFSQVLDKNTNGKAGKEHTVLITPGYTYFDNVSTIEVFFFTLQTSGYSIGGGINNLQKGQLYNN